MCLPGPYILSMGNAIEPAHLYLSGSGLAEHCQDIEPSSSPRLYHDKMEAYSRKVLEDALQRNDWNQTRAAEELGLQRTYFTKMLRQKQISGRPPKPSSDFPHA